MAETLFTRIAKGEIPAHRVAETDRCLAFLDIRPLKPGHTLCIPKQAVDHWVDLPPNLFTELMGFAQRVGRALQGAVPCKRVGVAVLGFEVPHAHIHLVPLDHEGELSFTQERTPMAQEDLAQMAQRINQAYQNLKA